MKKEIYDCLLCGTPLNDSVTWKSLLGNEYPKTICAECENEFEPVLKTENSADVISLFKYNDKMQDYLHRYKFMHDVVLAKVFRNQLRKHLSKRQEIIVPIPIHELKLKERTFAHIDELLIAANIPFKHFLEKLTIETQAQKSREERINTPQLFKLKQNVSVKNKDIILVDDIITTGTTIKHAQNLLLQKGGRSVKAFTLIRG
ncbi:ComF family protein [Ureibacillus manganicus]|uniref:Competence protein ComFC n=1 Tax=Ureibacillus manganicus DSM 26584 TaxID=1384049 RepID=A0A0A3I765_9BACL|nr:phosphoribosyltransferase family protein [Ureibacillus manganicus]KGR80621.1 competence protein ComFC [Ureibacillus manganicus DSM 26584]